jgi:hypothetical protein
MMELEQQKLKQLERKINDAIMAADLVDPDTIFEVLKRVFAFWMSGVRSDYRRHVASKLRADIPAMLNSADAFEAKFEADTSGRKHH